MSDKRLKIARLMRSMTYAEFTTMTNEVFFGFRERRESAPDGFDEATVFLTALDGWSEMVAEEDVK